jgi:guanine nucleotide-binding protein subunit alpha
MKLIYTKDGFTKNEKEEWRVIIFNNILDGLRMTIDAMEDFGIRFEYDNTSVRTPAKTMSTSANISRYTSLS